MAVDAQGNLYVSTDFNVYKVSPGGTITKVAGLDPNLLSKCSGDGGPAASATVAHAAAMAFDRHGNLYIADVADAAIRKIWKGSAAAPTSAKKKVARPKKAAHPSGPKADDSANALLRAAGSLEIDLGQMARDRAKLKSALAAVSTCSLSANAAAVQVAAVADGRQRLLNQLLKLHTPTAQLAQIASLLRQSLIHSIAADRHYRDWLAHQGNHCPTTGTPDLIQAQREDQLATAAKQRFVAAFNPLARQLHLRTWLATEF